MIPATQLVSGVRSPGPRDDLGNFGPIPENTEDLRPIAGRRYQKVRATARTPAAPGEDPGHIEIFGLAATCVCG